MNAAQTERWHGSYTWDRVWRVIDKIKSKGTWTPGQIRVLYSELEQMSDAQILRVKDECGEKLIFILTDGMEIETTAINAYGRDDL